MAGMPRRAVVWLFVILVGIFLLTKSVESLHSSVASQCPSEYAFNGDRNTCIKIHKDGVKRSWGQARTVCFKDGGDLAVVGDEASYGFIRGLVTDAGINYWIGLNCTEKDSKCMWVNGHPLQDEMFEVNSGSIEDGCPSCIAVGMGDRPWVEEGCDGPNGFVCERNATWPLICPGEDWTKNEANDMCYRINEKSMTWEQSRQQCIEGGGDLVVLQDSSTKAFVEGLVTGRHNQYWIGLWRDAEKSDSLHQWIDGSAFENLDNSVETGNNQKCGSLKQKGGETYNLDAAGCCQTFPSICEKNSSLENPVIRCPHGYTVYIKTNRNKVICLMAEHINLMTFSSAKERCMGTGGDIGKSGLMNGWVKQTVNDSLLATDKTYLVGKDNGTCYAFSGDFDQDAIEIECSVEHYFVCRQWATMSSVLDIASLKSYVCSVKVGDKIYRRALLSDPCVQSDNESLRGVLAHANVDAGLNDLPERQHYHECFQTTDRMMSCCALVTFQIKFDGKLRGNITFPAEFVSCLCLKSPNITITTRSCPAVTDSTTTTTHDIPTVTDSTTTTTHYIPTVTDSTTTTTHDIPTVTDSTTTTTHDIPTVTDSTTTTTHDIPTVTDSTTTTTHDIPTVTDSTTTTTHDIPTVTDSTTTTTHDIPTVTDSTTTTTHDIPTVTDSTTTTTHDIPTVTDSTTTTTHDIPTVTDSTSPPKQDPTPISQEAVQTLKNLTSSQHNNGSRPPNKLCPCGCDRVKFDPNPAPEVLFKTLSKIKTELKVDTEKLSKKRRRKISAKDDRAGSQMIGYMSLLLCSIPFCIIVGSDLIRLFQHIENKRSQKALNTDSDNQQTTDSDKVEHVKTDTTD